MTFDYRLIEKADHSLLTSYLEQYYSSVETAVDVLEVRREPEVAKDPGRTENASAANGSSDLNSGYESTHGEQQQPPGNLAVEGGSGSYKYQENLSHDKLVQHLEASRKGKDEPALRIIFVKETNFLLGSFDVKRPALSPQTIEYLIKDVGVSSFYISHVTRISGLLELPNALLKKWNSADNLKSIQGFYGCIAMGATYTRLWFSHNLEKRTSMYIICTDSEKVQKDIVGCAEDDHLRLDLLGPVAIDSLIMDQVSWSWSDLIVACAMSLLPYEEFRTETYTDKLINNAVSGLHRLSLNFQRIQEEMSSVDENINYILGIHALLAPSAPRRQQAAAEDEDTPCTTSAADSLSLIRSRTKKWQRWAANFRERTNIQINLFFNLSAQRDNRTNLKIADLTTKIAQETQKDSSSMITIAALTLIFLPGTFVAAVFSMVFFNTSPDVTTGAMSMTVAPGWWIYPTITIPFTIIVVAAWNMWRRRRNRMQGETFSLEEGVPPAVTEHTEQDSVWVQTTR